MMDLSTTTNLTQDERFEIAAMLHGLIIAELFRQTDWTAKDAVFHGGTSLAMVRHSERFSEDLDFMVSPSGAATLSSAMLRVRDRVALNMSIQYPRCRVELRGPKQGEVHQWSFVWSHPARRGNVNVKAEFLVTNENLLADYASTHIVPVMKRPIILSSQIPVPTLVSAWADKVKAIATRPAFKWRDAYDLSFVSHSMTRGNVSREEKKEALAATSAIYSKSLEEVVVGLERVLENGYLDDIDTFEADMRRWFRPDTFEARRRRGMFADDLSASKSEIEDAISLVSSNRPAPSRSL